MIRACGAVLKVVGLGGKAALSLTGVAVVLGILSAPPEATDPPRTKEGEKPEGRTIVRVPPGELMRGLTVVDFAGRELLRLNDFQNGGMIVSTGSGVPARIGLWASRDGRVDFVLHGEKWETRIQAGLDEKPEATLKTIDDGAVVGRLGPTED